LFEFVGVCLVEIGRAGQARKTVALRTRGETRQKIRARRRVRRRAATAHTTGKTRVQGGVRR
jgi:hypothetical protein